MPRLKPVKKMKKERRQISFSGILTEEQKRIIEKRVEKSFPKHYCLSVSFEQLQKILSQYDH